MPTMRVHTKTIDDCRRTFCLKVAVGLCATSALAWSELAHAEDCPAMLGPGGFEVLSGNLECDTSPALIIEGPVVVDLSGSTVTCVDDQTRRAY
jgi:hypothetical protein